MDKLATLTDRPYHLCDYYGAPDAKRVLVLMGSGADAARETIDHLNSRGEALGVLQIRLFRPFSPSAFVSALPKSVQAVAVLDRTKEPGADGEPLYKDVITSLSQAVMTHDSSMKRLPRVIGGRYGLSSKEFTPAMVAAIFDELKQDEPKNQFTVGIRDDLGQTSLDVDSSFRLPSPGVTQAIFYGLGADGTVGANKNTIKIIGEETDFYAQGYFVIDSKKSGSRTVSHLRFGPKPIRSSYLIDAANFVGCHQFNFVEQIDVLKHAAPKGVFLLNSPYSADEVWAHLPQQMQKQMIEKELSFYVIDAYDVAKSEKMGNRINTIMQTCFFAISGVLPREEAIAKIKEAIRKSYGSKGQKIVEQNFRAVDQALANLHKVAVPKNVSTERKRENPIAESAPQFVKQAVSLMLEDRGDELPVSALPNDGTYPSGSSRYEKRNISLTVPVWEPDLCIQCGNCSFVCPHSCIRSKLYHESELGGAPQTFQSAQVVGRGFPQMRYTLQVYVEDCTGCALCVDVCPVTANGKNRKHAINMGEKAPRLEAERAHIGFFESLPENDRSRIDFSTVRGVQFLQPLFEFSGACAGCGETPYLKVLSQLFGDRLLVANATGCSSIYGGNLPTTPWSINREGRGPAWSNSLFEDNAEFGLGFRLSADKHLQMAQKLLDELAPEIGPELVEEIISAPQNSEREIFMQRERLARAARLLTRDPSEKARSLLSLLDHLVRRSVWIVGGDGWAYDIGFGGLDHVLATGKDVNVLVLDTEVYSNTGGQASKSTPLGAVAKFASGGKPVGKKDLALMAIAYGNVYVARVSMGANAQQTLLALREAETYPGPSLILAYSHCIAHGIDMEQGLRQQHLAVECGYWPLFRYNPALREIGQNPMELDSARPTLPLCEYAYNENRYKVLAQMDPEHAERLMELAQAEVDRTWDTYEYLAQREMPAPPKQNGASRLA